MDVEYQTISCHETNQKVLLVKLSNGISKKFSFNVKTMSFDPMSCSDCEPVQMDCDLTPRHTEWCPHTRNTVVFAYNHVLKMELKYRFDCELGCFHEIECKDCHLNTAKTTDPRQIVLVATSPKSKRAIVLTMNKKGRVQKMQYDEEEKKYVDMEPIAVKALAQRTMTMVVKKEKKPENIVEALEKLDLGGHQVEAESLIMESDLIPLEKLELGGHQVEEESLIMESDLIPLYKEKSQILPNETIIIAKNRLTGHLGTYVFDRYIHQFLHVFLPDIQMNSSERNQTPIQKCIVLTMSSKTQEGINLQHKGEGIQKYLYNRQMETFELMPDTFVIQKASDIDLWIKKVFNECPCYTRKVHGIVDFMRSVKPFMIIQSTAPHKVLEFSVNEPVKDGEVLADDTASIDSSSEDSDSSEDTDLDSSSSSSDDDTDSISGVDSEDSFDIISDTEVKNSNK